MFKIYRGSGFHMKFENGYTISIQFGAGSYCQNHDRYPDLNLIGTDNINNIMKEFDYKLGNDGCIDAEIAIIKPDKELLKLPHSKETVKGYLSTDEVLKWMNYCASLPKENKYEMD